MKHYIGEILDKETLLEIEKTRINNDVIRLTVISANISEAVERCQIKSSRVLLLDINGILKTAITALNNHNPDNET